MDILSKHFAELRKLKILTIEEQNQLAEQALSGNTEARTRLIQSNLRLVVTIANKYRRLGVEVEELIAEGNLGLIKSINSFKPGFGNFTSWAYTYILKHITTYLFEKKNLIKVTRRNQKLGNDIIPTLSFDALEYQYDIADETNEYDNSLEVLRQVIQNNMDKLDPMHRELITLRYLEGKTLEETGEIMGKSRQGIFQMEKVALKKLKKIFNVNN